MTKKNPPKKATENSTKDSGNHTSANIKGNLNRGDSKEDQRGKGNSARKSNAETEDQNANQKAKDAV